jgi:Pyruvate/2-oxoacid:ferredoxin oxidoreductase gamma subunit
MERELLITGIGGQGVQLCAQVLARAATLEGREVMYLGLYGGMMRGGNTDSTVVVADAPILAPPVVSRAWSAIAMHDDYWPAVESKLRPGGLVLVNDTTFTAEVRDDVTIHRVPATTVATDLGSPLSGSMVMLGALRDHGHRLRSRPDRGDARVDSAVPHPTHRGERAGAQSRRAPPARRRIPGMGDRQCLSQPRR